MKKIILQDDEYEVLIKVLNSIPPARLPRILPGWTGVDMFYYRRLLAKVLSGDYSFPKTDDGMGVK